MDEELAIIQSARDKIALSNRKKDVAILKQALEPIEEVLSDLKSTIQESIDLEKKEKPQINYFDKEFNSKITSALEKVFGLLQKLKQPDINIDLSPVNSIASEIKKQNENIISLLNKPNQSEELQRLISLMVGKQNAFLEREFKQSDYSKELSEINQSIENNKPKEWEFTIIRVDDSSQRIKKVIAKSK